MEIQDKEYFSLVGAGELGSFLNSQKQFPLCFIYLYPMADSQDERPLQAGWQKTWGWVKGSLSTPSVWIFNLAVAITHSKTHYNSLMHSLFRNNDKANES